jgi:glycosyltransferase involved in cell wall biosynthesis
MAADCQRDGSSSERAIYMGYAPKFLAKCHESINSDSKLMNILLVTEDFLLDGVTRHIVDLANGLTEAGHNVFVAATMSTQKERLNPAVTFVPLHLCYPKSYKKKYFGILQSLKILIRTVRENNIDIIHTHKRYADLIGRIVARITGVKHVSTCHNEFRNYRWLSPFGDITIAPSPEIAQMLIDKFDLDKESIKIVFYGIKPFKIYNVELIKQYKKTLNIENGIKVILSVGHLNKQKDRPTLIEAIHLLKVNGRFEKTICLIVGEGVEYSQVQAMIRNYQLESSIKLLPALSDIEALNNIADFCVLSSIHEAAPHVILEAASVRKPHIATKVGFIPGFMENDKAGVCVPPRNPKQLADGIYSLLSNPKKTAELGENAYERFQQNYTYDKFIRNTLSVYEEVLSNRSKRITD